MTTAQINLTDSQIDALRKLAKRTGKSEDEILQEAVNKLIDEVGKAEAERQEWLEVLQQAKGIWKDRDDLPNLKELREEADRFSGWSREQ